VHEDLGKERRHHIKDRGTEIIRQVTAEAPAGVFSRRNKNNSPGHVGSKQHRVTGSEMHREMNGEQACDAGFPSGLRQQAASRRWFAFVGGKDGFARVKLAPHAAPEPFYQPLDEPLINSKMVAEVPLAGLSFPSLQNLPRQRCRTFACEQRLQVDRRTPVLAHEQRKEVA
jgi:hypothetical protein